MEFAGAYGQCYSRRTMSESKTQRALALMEQGLSAAKAAKAVGLSIKSVPALYRAREAAKSRIVCPCCGQALRAGAVFRVSESVVDQVRAIAIRRYVP